MKNMTKAAAIAALAAAMTINASAQQGNYGPYLSGKVGGFAGGIEIGGGAAWDFDFLGGGAIALGYEFNDAVRIELEAAGFGGDMESDADMSYYDDVSAVVGMLSLQGYLTVPLTANVSLYFNAGAGGLNCSLEAGTGDFYLEETRYTHWWGADDVYHTYREAKAKEDATFFFWNVGIGLQFWLNNNIAIDVSGRYLGTGKSDFDSTKNVSLELYGAWAGLAFYF